MIVDTRARGAAVRRRGCRATTLPRDRLGTVRARPETSRKLVYPAPALAAHLPTSTAHAPWRWNGLALIMRHASGPPSPSLTVLRRSGSDPEDCSRPRPRTYVLAIALLSERCHTVCCDTDNRDPGVPCQGSRLPILGCWGRPPVGNALELELDESYLLVQSPVSTLLPGPFDPSACLYPPLPGFNARLRTHDRSRGMSLSVSPCTSVTTLRPHHTEYPR